jgi:hypothetical protein
MPFQPEFERALGSDWTRSIRLPEPSCSMSSCSPTLTGADAIGSYWGNLKTRTFAELLIDCEEDRTLRAVLVGMLREMERE